MPENVFKRPFEIAALFGVFTQTIHANIRAIFKSGIVRADIFGTVMLKGGIIMPLAFGLDMIIAFALIR